MKKILYILSLALVCACNSGTVIPPVDPPVPPAPQKDTSFSYQVNISDVQSAVRGGFDSLAVSVSGLPKGYDDSFNAVYSTLVFNIDGDESLIGTIEDIRFSTQSSDISVRPFGLADVDVRIDSAGIADYRYSAVVSKSKSAATISGPFTAGVYSFVAFPGDYDGATFMINYSDGTSETVSNPGFSFSTELRGSAKLPGLTIGSGPEPQRDTTFTYSVKIYDEQNAVKDGYDADAVVVTGLPKGYDESFNEVYSQFQFKLSGDASKISEITSITFATASVEIDARPFGVAEVEATVDKAGNATFSFQSDLSKSGTSVTLSGSFTAGDYAFAGFPGKYEGSEYLICYSDGSSESFSDPEFSFVTDFKGAADLPAIIIGSGPGPGPGPGPSVSSHKWFELPAYSDEDNNGIDDYNPDYYYSFTFRADAEKIRNFSCCYSKGKIHPVWVAAPMHSCYKGSSGRNDSYKPDPQIKCTQAGSWSGYTRGHMLGSSDRTISKPTNRQVFYYSNIGAQLSSGFNTGGGAWNMLEDLVDSQWCSDTLYQVIGCIFDTWTDKYGKTVSPRTVDGSQIPTAYYKVLLRTKKGNSGKSVDKCSADELQCAAFILAHRGNQKHEPCEDDLYTVEYVEGLTGLDFFVNVPNAPKSTVSADDWGL